MTNPLGYAGYPPGVTGTPSTQPSAVRAATAQEATDGLLNDVYISPATLGGETALDFASPPALGFGSTTPRPVASTTLTSTLNTSIASATTATTVNILNGAVAGAGLVSIASGAIAATTIVNILTGTPTGGAIQSLNLVGSTGRIGFFGATSVVRQSQGAITNSVTAGGTTGTIANFTDLTTYATDAATIRNDIYQLALGLSGVVTALRNYGLLV